MELRGDLGSTTLEELFGKLVEKNASGTLLLSSPDGEKRITLSDGEIVLLTNQASERLRIGDLLVGRGKLTEAQLKEALSLQRQGKKKVLMGELLIDKGFVSKQDVQAAIRFQLEEEICDVFAWKDVEYEFESGRKVATFQVEKAFHLANSDTQTRRLTAEAEAVIKEATRRADEVKQFTQRLSSPYLCFKLSELGAERAKDCALTTQKILRLIRQGRTLETIVKQSYLGRLSVYQSVIRLLDDGWIIPFPGSELRYLASEHRAQGRYADALHIYRRLLDNASNDSDRLDLERLIDDTTEAILKSKLAGEQPEGFDPVRHKGLADRYFRRRRLKRIILVGVLLTLMAFLISYAMSRDPRVSPSSRYLAALRDSELAVSNHQYEEAIKIWSLFYETLDDPESKFAALVRAKHERLMRTYKNYVEMEAEQARLMVERGQFDEAKAKYLKILETYPNNELIGEIKAAVEGLDAKKEKQFAAQSLAILKDKLKEAQELEAQKLFQSAKESYTRLVEDAASVPQLVDEARAGVERLKVIAERSKRKYEEGLKLVEAGRAAQGLETFYAAQTEWPELEWAQRARDHALELRMKQDHLREKIGIASAAEARGAVTQAVATLERILEEYKEFEETKELKERIERLSGHLRSAEQLLQQAQEAERKHDRAKALDAYAVLLRRHSRFLVAKQVKAPLYLETEPAGAQVTLNERVVGNAPLRVELPIEGIHKLTFSLAGFTSLEKVLRGIGPEDLEMKVRLDWAALRTSELGGSVMAPMLCHGERVYVSVGTGLQAWEAAAATRRWMASALVDASQTSRPGSEGSKHPVFVADKTWWNLRCPPAVYGPEHLLVATRDRKVLKLKAADGASETLFELPVESVGPLFVEEEGMAGTTRVGVVCADGTMLVYSPGQKAAPLWSQAIDTAPYPGRKPVGGALPGGAGAVVTASRSGMIRAWGMRSGSVQWQLRLGVSLASIGRLPAPEKDPRSRPCALLTESGGVILVDLIAGKKMWALEPSRTGEEAVAAALDGAGLLILTQNGSLRRYPPPDALRGAAQPVWEALLGSAGLAPLSLPEIVFVGTSSGHVHALSAKDGSWKWRYQCETRPVELATDGRFLYVATEGGKLIVFSVP